MYITRCIHRMESKRIQADIPAPLLAAPILPMLTLDQAWSLGYEIIETLFWNVSVSRKSGKVLVSVSSWTENRKSRTRTSTSRFLRVHFRVCQVLNNVSVSVLNISVSDPKSKVSVSSLSPTATSRLYPCTGLVKEYRMQPNRISGVARICCEEGQSWTLDHEALTVDFRAGCSSCSMTNSFVTNAVLIERAVSCWHPHQLISQTTQYLDSWLSNLLQSELKMKLLEVEGARAPVPHS